MKILEIIREDLNPLQQKRADFIKSKLSAKFSPDKTQFASIDDLIQHVAQFDPTPNGAFMPWIVKCILSDPEKNRVEDLPKLSTDLKAFEKNKRNIENKDINSYKSFIQVYEVVKPFLEPKKKTPHELKQEKIRNDIANVYIGPEGWIKIPTTKAAAQYLGQHTRWCTAGNKDNAFDTYNRQGPLFVIYDKESKQRIQLHVPTGQVADEEDKSIKCAPIWAQAIIKKYVIGQSSNLRLKDAISLGKITGFDGIDVDDDYKDILDLIKKY